MCIEMGCVVSGPDQEFDLDRSNATLSRILAHRAKFLSFLAARVENNATAEDILQSAYIKAMERGSEIRDEENTVAWFYRVLRNAVVDHYRKRSLRERAHEALANAPVSYEPELEPVACACIGDVVQELKGSYRSAIEQVDLGGMTVDAYATAEHTTANNVSVRLYRARREVAKQLRAVCGACAQHQCLDCTCRRSQL